ncbi:LysM domain receptor-like kinase 4 [Apostasia shenzhenica]|uniref:non-specific serine/threonine protein kinase n=1 Tax=Apostasia shenzhenica TaxID=1088818 RepID=A0A2I0AX92_9ASPA|nr:LysM domain receptor-like kinase 4 [Apostasia shenzhenica]
MRREAHGLLFALCSLAVVLPARGQNSHGYRCYDYRRFYPCQAYAYYLVGADPSLLDLASIGDLFGISRLMIARSSNLSVSSVLRVGESLLIPLPCSCHGNRSYAPVAYQILAGDTFHTVSAFKFGNLTAYPDVEDVNPTHLVVGDVVTFPLFCQCPKRPSLLPAILTYVLQPSDSYESVAARFGSDLQSLISLNGREGSVPYYSTILVPVSQIPPPSMKTNLLESQQMPPLPPPAMAAEGAALRGNAWKAAVVGLAIAVALMGILWILLLVQISRRWRLCWWVIRAPEEEWGGGGEQKLMADLSECLDKYKVYQIEELRGATAGFDDGHLIGGSVYRGEIDGEVYAIKKMKWNASDELKILQKVNHTNLVKLEGFCIEPDAGSCYLVYEYVENGSLHTWLHGPTLARRLDWRIRLRIAGDLAHGLQYIHEHTWPRVVHRDVKSSNVLLDGRLRAKVANFGLARSGRNAATAHVAGTPGYAAPEYIAGGVVSTRMDVFSYGVVLLELVSGREAAAAGEGGRTLWEEAEEGVLAGGKVRVGRMAAWMDPALAEQPVVPMDGVAAVVGIAGACLQRNPARRPTMMEVAYALARAEEVSNFSIEETSVPVAAAAAVAR